jgi:hypothetical protein
MLHATKTYWDFMDGIEHFQHSEHKLYSHFTAYLRKYHYYCIFLVTQLSHCAGCIHMEKLQ